MIIFAMVLTALHAGLFSLVFTAYRRFGWPPYLIDIAERIPRMELWRTSIRRSWWVLPFFACSHQLWYWFAMGQSYAQLSSVPLGELFDLAICGLATATYGLIAGRTIRSFVCNSIKPEEHRCTQCAYLRRGLTSSVCPECGYEQTTTSPDFGLYRSKTLRWLAESQVSWIVLTMLTLTSPAWLAGLLASVPDSMLSRKMSPWVRSFVMQQKNRPWGAPVKLGAFALIRTNDTVVAFYSPLDSSPGLHVRWWYWKSPSGWTSRPPDESGVEPAPLNMQSQKTIAGLLFYFCEQQWGSDRWLHLGWLATNVECEVVESERAPEFLQGLAAAATSAP